jgi:tyrosyl-tRNA synthetase
VRSPVYVLPDIPDYTNTRAGGKIDLLDPADLVLKKVKKAFAAPKEVEGNGVLALIEYVLLPVSLLKTGERKFVVERERDGLEPLVYTEISKLHEDYRNEVVWPSSRR